MICWKESGRVLLEVNNIIELQISQYKRQKTSASTLYAHNLQIIEAQAIAHNPHNPHQSQQYTTITDKAAPTPLCLATETIPPSSPRKLQTIAARAITTINATPQHYRPDHTLHNLAPCHCTISTNPQHYPSPPDRYNPTNLTKHYRPSRAPLHSPPNHHDHTHQSATLFVLNRHTTLPTLTQLSSHKQWRHMDWIYLSVRFGVWVADTNLQTPRHPQYKQHKIQRYPLCTHTTPDYRGTSHTNQTALYSTTLPPRPTPTKPYQTNPKPKIAAPQD